MKRSRTILLAAAIVVAVGLLFWLWAGLQGQARIVEQNAEASHKTIEYHGVEVEIPSEWERADLSDCEFQFEHWGPPGDSDCQGTHGVSFYGSDRFDPARDLVSMPTPIMPNTETPHSLGTSKQVGLPSMRPTMIGPSWSECWTLSPSAEITSRRGAGSSPWLPR